MAKFSKTVEFLAYQYNNDELKGMNDDSIEDVIIEALELKDEINCAFITDNGNLYVVLRTYGIGSSNECFELDSGDWLTFNDHGDLFVVADAKFQQFATPVN